MLSTHVAALLIAAAFAAPCTAEEGLSVGVAPSLLEVQASQTGPVTYPLTVFNDGTTACSVDVIFLDFTVGPTGDVLIIEGEPGMETFSAARWLSVSTQSLVLEPGSERDIALTVTPPRDAEPGTHRALVDFRATQPGAPSSSDGVNVRANIPTVVLVTVPGKAAPAPVLELDVPWIAFGDPVVIASISNPGTAHCFVDGALSISDRSTARARYEHAFQAPERGALVLPASERVFASVWDDAPLLGHFTARAQFDVTGAESVQASTAFWVVRWPLLAAAVVVVVLGLAAFVFARRFRVVRREDP